MRFLFALVLLGQIFSSISGQSESTPNISQRISFQDSIDWSPIGEAIGDRRIVAIGESTHGSAEMYVLKSSLVNYLWREKGFDVVAIESGLGDVNMAFSMIDTLSAIELRDKSLFHNFRAEEINPLFDSIRASQKSSAPLVLTGFDTQSSSNYLLDLVSSFIQDIDADFAASIKDDFNSMYAMVAAARASDSIGYYDHRNRFQASMLRAVEIVDNNKANITNQFSLTPFQLAVVQRSLTTFSKSIDLPYSNWYGGIALRDELMAENLIWLLEEFYPDKKVIIWAHNGHVEKGPSYEGGIKWMGHFLKEKYSDDYYSIGLFAQKGVAFQHWSQQSVTFDNDKKGSIENLMHPHAEQTYFLNIPTENKDQNAAWLFDSITGFELESNGEVQFIPAKRFDGVICIPHSSVPSYD